MKSKIQLSDHFSTGRLMRFTSPTILVMIVMSTYLIADGLFTSNFVGNSAFAAQNLIGNYLFLLMSVGYMLGSGGSAMIGKTLGEGKKDQANREFSMIIICGLILGIAFMVLSAVTVRKVSVLMGAEGQLLEYCLQYGGILSFALPGAILQGAYQYLFSTAEKAELGMVIGLGTSLMNIVLDTLFIVFFHWGLIGASVATLISMICAGVIPTVYFLRENGSKLRLVATRMEYKPLLNACVNGASELLSTISVSVIAILYNFQLMRFIGEGGVAAYGVVTTVTAVFTCVFTGYGMGVTPVIGYHYGAKNDKEMKNLFWLSFRIVAVFSALLGLLCYTSAGVFARCYLSAEPELIPLGEHGLRIFTLAFLFIGFNVFASTLFTALNNGLISGILSTLRTLIFQIVFILLLPKLLGVDGIWWAVVPAELCSLIVVIFFIVKEHRKYHYY